MLRKYKKVAGSRPYKNYTEETLEEALQKVVEGAMSINAAAQAYSIPFGTLYNKYKGIHGSTPGGQSVFTHAEECAILKSAATCADWGFPLTTLDLRMFAKSFLDKQGKSITRFANNLPGIDWATSLLKRHRNGYGQRIATNIKRARAEVDHESLNKYFDNLQREVLGIPPANIFNYDESNLSDDPGKKLCIYRRGVKYPEKVMNHSKSSTTVMLCGSADGTLLPPYVIYKSVHLYDTWKERGIIGYPCCGEPCCSRGSRYNRTVSGWIDTPTFRDWFKTCFLPHANRLEGRKVLIGDNLSAHLDNDILVECASNNISFVCLVPHSTHICQPLDVGLFRPMKGAWRKTLQDWKISNLKASSVPKDAFPRLLKQALIEMDKKQPPNVNEEELNSAVKRSLISSFKATGIIPFDRMAVLKKVPNESDASAVERNVRDNLTKFLKDQRFGGNVEPTRKKKRIQVEPGKSISVLDEAGPSRVVQNVETPGDEMSNGNPSPEDCVDDRESFIDDQIMENRESDPLGRQESDPLGSQEGLSLRSETIDNGGNCTAIIEDQNEEEMDQTRALAIGDFILAKFSSAKGKKTYQYVCAIEDIAEDKYVVLGYKSQNKQKNTFRAVENDISIVERLDIVTYLPQPRMQEGCYIFPSEINVKEL